MTVSHAFVFLGNPGRLYERTRHNAGQLLLARLNYPFEWQKKFKGRFAKRTQDGGAVYFLEPGTFMNLSGESAAELASYFKIEPQNIAVVHDEIELTLGQCALKFGGGLGGHNGLRSIKAALGTADFWRLRIGVGRPSGEKANADIAGWVLSNFTEDELGKLNIVLDCCARTIEKFIADGPESLLPEWNKINLLAA